MRFHRHNPALLGDFLNVRTRPGPVSEATCTDIILERPCRAGICFVHVNNLCYMVSKNGILYKESVCCFIVTP